jgi:hypothetical protein
MPGDRDRLSFDPAQQYRSVVAQQGRVMVPADWNEAQEIAGDELRKETLDFVGTTGTPDDGYRIGFLKPVVPNPGDPNLPDFLISPGTMYVGGIRVQLASADSQDLSYSHQPDWLDPPLSAPSDFFFQHFFSEYVFLRLREQEISATEDSSLMEVALGGPDTTQRTRIIQQIERTAFPHGRGGDCERTLSAQEAVWTAAGQTFDRRTMRLSSKATLKVGFAASPPPDPCDPVAQGGYLGAENQLIRVRISAVPGPIKAGTPGPAKFVWGYDNSSFLYRVKPGIDNQTLTLDTPPVDAFHYPKAGQAVEVLRTQCSLPDGGFIAADTGQVFTLTQSYVPESQSVKLPTPFTNSAGTPQLFLRVWQSEVSFTPGTAVTLDATGVQVTLQAPGNIFHIGDYWAFAVRPSTPTQVYKQRYLTDFQPPDGPRQWICPLGIIGWEESRGALFADCRNQFENLVDLTRHRCCTVVVQPEDLTHGTTLQSIADQLKGTQSTICLKPGSYLLSVPLVLTSLHSGLTIEGCHPDVFIARVGGKDKDFLPGLVVLNEARDITLRGLRFVPPLAKFLDSGGLLADIPAPTLGAPPIGLDLQQTYSAIGIRLLNSPNAHIENCVFEFSADAQGFQAGIFAMADCGALVLKNNQFLHNVSTVLEGEVRFGFVMTPSISRLTLNPALVGTALATGTGAISAGLTAPATANPSSLLFTSAGATTQNITLTSTGGSAKFTASVVSVTGGSGWLSPAPVSGSTPATVSVTVNSAGLPPGTYNAVVQFSLTGANNSAISVSVTLVVVGIDAVIIPTFLDKASISGNTFEGLSVAALIYAELGDMRIESNTVRACYSGFHLHTLRFQILDPLLQAFHAIWMDRPFVAASAFGQGFPMPPDFTPSNQNQIAVKAVPWPQMPSFPADPARAGAVMLASVFAAVDNSAFAIANLPRRQSSSIIVTANDIDAGPGPFFPGPSGPAFVFWGDGVNLNPPAAPDADSRLILSANSMRGSVYATFHRTLPNLTNVTITQSPFTGATTPAPVATAVPPPGVVSIPFPSPDVAGVPIAAVLRAPCGAITGNLILNQANLQNTSIEDTKLSLVVGPPPPHPTEVTLVGTPAPPGTRVAITGNTLRGVAVLPPHDSAVAPFNTWDPLNLFIPE